MPRISFQCSSAAGKQATELQQTQQTVAQGSLVGVAYSDSARDIETVLNFARIQSQ